MKPKCWFRTKVQLLNYVQGVQYDFTPAIPSKTRISWGGNMSCGYIVKSIRHCWAKTPLIHVSVRNWKSGPLLCTQSYKLRNITTSSNKENRSISAALWNRYTSKLTWTWTAGCTVNMHMVCFIPHCSCKWMCSHMCSRGGLGRIWHHSPNHQYEYILILFIIKKQ